MSFTMPLAAAAVDWASPTVVGSGLRVVASPSVAEETLAVRDLTLLEVVLDALTATLHVSKFGGAR